MTDDDDDDFDTGKRNLRCPCGEAIHGETQDELIERVQAHLAADHPGRTYTRNEILFMAH